MATYYTRSDTVKILRTMHKVTIHRTMTRGDIMSALENVPAGLALTAIFEVDEHMVRFEFLEEKEPTP